MSTTTLTPASTTSTIDPATAPTIQVSSFLGSMPANPLHDTAANAEFACVQLDVVINQGSDANAPANASGLAKAAAHGVAFAVAAAAYDSKFAQLAKDARAFESFAAGNGFGDRSQADLDAAQINAVELDCSQFQN